MQQRMFLNMIKTPKRFKVFSVTKTNLLNSVRVQRQPKLVIISKVPVRCPNRVCKTWTVN